MLTLAAQRPATIREMQPADIAFVSELAARTWRAHYVPDIVSAEQIDYMLSTMCSPEALVRGLNQNGQCFWLIFDEKKLAGYLACERLDKSRWYIDKLYIDTDKHGQGFGGRLLAHMIESLKPKEITLRVNRKNIQAINFYFRHGFTIERISNKEIGEGFVMEDFIMKRVF